MTNTINTTINNKEVEGVNNMFEVKVDNMTAMLNLSKLAHECGADIVDVDGKIFISDPTGALTKRLSGSSMNIKDTALKGVEWVGNRAISATVSTIEFGASVACLGLSLTNSLVRQAAPKVEGVASSTAKTTLGLLADSVLEGRRFAIEQSQTEEAARVKEAGSLLYSDAKGAATSVFGWAKKKLSADSIEGVRVIK